MSGFSEQASIELLRTCVYCNHPLKEHLVAGDEFVNPAGLSLTLSDSSFHGCWHRTYKNGNHGVIEALSPWCTCNYCPTKAERE